jgi:acyl-CoA dehydrogenase
MDSDSAPRFAELIDAVRKVATDVAAPQAADVDAKARFPIETLAALREYHVLSAAVPRELGGAGCTMEELAQLCSTLGQSCGSSAMVLAMHYIQLACIARHGMESDYFRGYLRDLVKRQYLLASMTSENGTFGDTRSSICAVRRSNGGFQLDKDATTGSYCAHSDAILVTCRKDEDAARSDQVLVLVKREDCTLAQTTSWDTLGMRGTCSPGFKLESHGAQEQVLPVPYADISAQTMVPYSHILWASLWWGIASDALGRAAQFVRADARKKPGTVPPNAARLARAHVELQSMRHNWESCAQEFDELGDDRAPLDGMGWALKMNQLKMSCSEMAPRLVHEALQIIGIMAYKNDSKFSVGRHYRDVLSAALMVSNERIAGKSASMLLVFKDD